MPELPEVEIMIAYLRERAIDGEIVSVRVLRNNGKYLSPDERPLIGQTLHTVGRRGKFMVFHLSKGLLVAHNAMSGYWDIKGDEWCFDYVEGARVSNDSDIRVEIDVICDKERKTIRYHDARLFGSLRYHPGVRSIQDIPSLSKLGPEAICTPNVDLTIDRIDKDWNVLDAAMMLNSKTEIKHSLLDQSAVAGFGNIYAVETLYAAGINPFRITKTLNGGDFQRVFECGQEVLKSALDRKLDYSVLKVYRQKMCLPCETPIMKKDLRGRSTYFCPSCQK